MKKRKYKRNNKRTEATGILSKINAMLPVKKHTATRSVESAEVRLLAFLASSVDMTFR